jgi:hypothetical protein
MALNVALGEAGTHRFLVCDCKASRTEPHADTAKRCWVLCMSDDAAGEAANKRSETKPDVFI